jgi:hypothetical protein
VNQFAKTHVLNNKEMTLKIKKIRRKKIQIIKEKKIQNIKIGKKKKLGIVWPNFFRS